MINLLLAAGAGAALAYFFDPDRGTRRRHVARDRVSSLARRGAENAARYTQYSSGVLRGIQHRITGAGSHEVRIYDDATLAHKVETELFRDADVPKGKINVNAENGVIYLRGEANTPDQINSLVATARRIEGVQDVQNLLHLPNTPPKAPGHAA